ncbi:MAG: hypothetical protein IRZ32_12885 [Solirubrobacteraceae bacterium]|mgnify:CR=1 FL=1|nr:hypothetical protein [Solirubrobacteraceae bacterium]
MAHDVAGLLLAGILIAAAGMKAAAPRASARALATFGVRRPAAQAVVLAAVVAAEAAVAAGVALGSDAAAFAGAGLMALFAGAQATALARGRRGAPCACFGAGSAVGPWAVARAAALAAALAVLPALPRGPAPAEAWLALGLAACAVAIVALTVAVAALAREIGVLRMALGPQQALEIPDEGPPLGAPSPVLRERALAGRDGPPARLALAVFTSEGCRLCRAVAPAVALLAREPGLAVAVLDEVRDADAWAAAAIPGSPYAVALDPGDGTVLAKGTFNGLGQLESVLATAQRRAAGRDPVAAGVGGG